MQGIMTECEITDDREIAGDVQNHGLLDPPHRGIGDTMEESIIDFTSSRSFIALGLLRRKPTLMASRPPLGLPAKSPPEEHLAITEIHADNISSSSELAVYGGRPEKGVFEISNDIRNQCLSWVKTSNRRG